MQGVAAVAVASVRMVEERKASRISAVASICDHGRRRSDCMDCGGGSTCEHGRRMSRCKECGGGSICAHGLNKQYCKAEECRHLAGDKRKR